MSDKKVICRCEDVTLHEIDEALAKGFHDIESVKRFTGLGTGWCQGKSCLAPCSSLLRERTGVTPSGPFTPRPPVHPLPLSYFAKWSDDDD